MKNRFRGLFYLAMIITLLVPCTTKAQRVPNAIAWVYFELPTHRPKEFAEYNRHGTFNYYYSYDFECDWTPPGPVVCYGKLETSCTAILKPGWEPSIKLSYKATYRSELQPDFGYGVKFLAESEIGYFWRLRDIHPLAPRDVILPISIESNIEMSVNAAKYSIYEARASVGVAKHMTEFIVSQTDPEPKSAHIFEDKNCGLNDLNFITIAASLLITPHGPLIGPELVASADILVDPTITIDPDFMVNINGVDYPANQLYEVELSPNLFYPNAMPWIPLLLDD